MKQKKQDPETNKMTRVAQKPKWRGCIKISEDELESKEKEIIGNLGPRSFS